MHPKGLFWLQNDFIRTHAKKLSIYAQMVYVALCCHADKSGITFIGCRKISEDLGIDKNTVQKKIKELEKAQLVERLDAPKGKPSHMKIFTVPFQKSRPYSQIIPKDNIKDKYKDRTNKYKRYEFGTYEELLVYKFPDGYKVYSDKLDKFMIFSGDINKIKKI